MLTNSQVIMLLIKDPVGEQFNYDKQAPEPQPSKLYTRIGASLRQGKPVLENGVAWLAMRIKQDREPSLEAVLFSDESTEAVS